MQSFAPNIRKVNYLMEELQDRKYANEIRIYHLQSWIGEKGRNVLESVLGITMKAVNSQIGAEALGISAGALQEGGAFLYIGWLALAGRISLGDVTMYVSAINNFAVHMKNCMSQYVVLEDLAMYYEPLKEFLERETKKEAGNTQPAPGREKAVTVEFDHVWFRYPGSGEYVLQDVSFVIAPEEKISIVGDNGAGKTTLVKLLMGLYQPDKGQIRVNGVNIQNYNMDDYWDRVGVVFQDYKTLAFTLEENILLGREVLGSGETGGIV